MFVSKTTKTINKPVPPTDGTKGSTTALLPPGRDVKAGMLSALREWRGVGDLERKKIAAEINAAIRNNETQLTIAYDGELPSFPPGSTLKLERGSAYNSPASVQTRQEWPARPSHMNAGARAAEDLAISPNARKSEPLTREQVQSAIAAIPTSNISTCQKVGPELVSSIKALEVDGHTKMDLLSDLAASLSRVISDYDNDFRSYTGAMNVRGAVEKINKQTIIPAIQALRLEPEAETKRTEKIGIIGTYAERLYEWPGKRNAETWKFDRPDRPDE